MIVLLSSFGFAETKSASSASTTAQTTAAADDVKQKAADAKNISTVTAAAVEATEKTASLDPSSLSPKSNITTDAAAATEKNGTAIKDQVNAINASLAAIPLPGLPASRQSLSLISSNVEAYFNAKKKLCSTTAETANFLCSEGTSPGAKAVKMLMDVGAPVLGVISSAQKACSTTAKLTSFAGSALTVAKGLCVAAKTTCDFSCTAATAQLATIEGQIRTFGSYFTYDVDSTMVQLGCPASIPNEVICAALAKAKVSVPSQITALAAAAKPEGVTSELGSSTNIAAKCTGYSKDIVLMAVNLASLLAAKSSADKCSDDLKNSTTAATTPLQYCETPANTNTQYCICLKDNTKIGCPGYVATALNTDTTAAAAETGVDVKSTGTANQFASGSNPVVPTSALGGVNGLGTTAADKAANKKTDAAVTTAPLVNGSFGDGGSAGAGAPSADLNGSAAKDAKAGSDKKWSFGSFSGGGGGGYGGGDSSGNGANGSKLGQKDMDAIKRQIASEQLRAEVSEASGKSNWEKVRERYLMNSASLLNGK